MKAQELIDYLTEAEHRCDLRICIYDQEANVHRDITGMALTMVSDDEWVVEVSPNGEPALLIEVGEALNRAGYLLQRAGVTPEALLLLIGDGDEATADVNAIGDASAKYHAWKQGDDR